KYAQNGEYKKLRNELKLERVRQKLFSQNVSRLDGLYFFENEEIAHTALDRWNIPNKKQYISEINFSANFITRVDSEWITSYLLSDDEEWMTSYWAGKTLGEKPLTEVLACGIGIIQNTKLREQAYQNILEIWPDSSPLLASACCAFANQKMENIAMVRPAFIREQDKLVGQYFINMDDLNKNEKQVVKAVQQCKDDKNLPPIIKSFNPDIFFKLPDLESEKFEFERADILSIYEQIHNIRGVKY
ncbi:MAG: hypothetical protein J0647_10770, partial [Campylobacteraceae bacterium]|nr:hypothetical protein [Campylobacteraceae bacterium]